MMSTTELNQLEDLSKTGVGLRELLLAAYQVGKSDGLNDRRLLDQNNELAMRNLDRWHEWRGGCFNED